LKAKVVLTIVSRGRSDYTGRKTMAITRLIYFSENQIDSGQGSVVRQLSKILSAANKNNKPLGLTGALVFDDLWFLQTLEGSRDNVWKTFERIKGDERHTNVTLVEVTDVPSRIFGNWWMGFAQRNAETESAFKPYLQGGRIKPTEMTAQQILTLMIELSKLGLSRELAATDA
jgi:hypothetical protein